jgi:hypothetical protein
MPVIINGSTGISGTDGSAGTPAVQGTDTNTGMFFPAADTIAFAEGGVEVMRIDSAGNVGIGTTSPSTRLTVSSSTSTTSSTVSNNSSSSEWQQNGNDLYISNYSASGAAIFRTNGTEQARITSAGNFQFNSGYGSVATAYGCRAWVNFNGTGTVAIRASGNVSSITDNGTGDYTVNFTTAMPDANYSVVGTTAIGSGGSATNITSVGPRSGIASPLLTTSARVITGVNGGASDSEFVSIGIFR